ncbi:MAG: Asp-tRNA(Asn)/Glu-tRNA(Gln) amidotransferase subunit GatA [Oscillospiraceae bacterium]|nr:Asp-tRNA(Asn)/Glu-tRNA(Gln) amidotransferase subunit GatA [Oscillospiraceae bacterium]
MELYDLSALALAAAIRDRQVGVAEAAGAFLDRIEKTDPAISAFITVDRADAMARAAAAQAAIDAGEATSPLAGVPVGVKDNISVRGLPTSCASKILEGYVPVFDATVTDRLTQAGLVVVGKLNMDEFAMGGSTETGVHGPTRNPWDTARVPGGSSGGSAAAVAAREIPLALGSDTGGSIRQPCAFCGATGLKPTYGAVSRYGLVAYASSLDQIGPIARSVDDCAALLAAISGPDARDSTCVVDAPFAFDQTPDEGLDGMTVGLPRNYFEGGIDGDVKKAVLAAAKQLEALGARVEEFVMPMMEYTVPAYYIIACAEASSNLSRFDGVKYGYRSPKAATLSELYLDTRSEGFGLEVKRRMMLGNFVLSSGYYDAYYKKALQARALIKDAYNALFKKYDLILSPVAPTTAYHLGENLDDPLKMYMGDIYTVPVNLAGLPAVAMPCGFDGQGLPVGFQLVGDTFAEPLLIRAGRAYQRVTAHHLKQPGREAE